MSDEQPKKSRGRPRTGETPPAVRAARAKQALIDAGGRRVSLNLSADAVQCVEGIKAGRGIATDREVVEFALTFTIQRLK